MEVKCENCGKMFDKATGEVNRSEHHFCGHSCAASFNNRGVRRHGSPKGLCVFCGKLLAGSQKKYCSPECDCAQRWEMVKQGIKSKGQIADTCRGTGRKYLIEKRGHRCEICGVENWRGQLVALNLDHVDGNASNGLLTNLRLVCPNCDAQLPTYKGRNRGKGRSQRRKHP